MRPALLVALLALAHVGCDLDVDVVGPTPVAVARADLLPVGRPFSSAILATDPTCFFDGLWHPCRRFIVAPLRSGVLRITVWWFGHPHRLALNVLNRPACCVSPLFRELHVVRGHTYDVIVLLIPAPGILMTPHIVQPFEVAATLR